MKPHEIRSQYLEFFKSKGHEIVESDSLVPSKDPTLLFTTAGMVQFKSLYAGAPLTFSKASTVQKCLRAGGKDSDLERVGKTLRHHTFFEMLGNFSFGDYFKEEAIAYANEFIFGVLKMDKSKIWVSVYEDDDEAKAIWIKNGFPAERIVKLGKKDNFWGPAGSEGACGPCSEIYYDLGPVRSCGKADCAVGCDCERYLEFWNLVFPQFYQEKDGSRKPLARKGVDTGMGLERISFLMDPEAENNYQTQIFKNIIQAIEKIADQTYTPATCASYHVVADHLRALTFAIGDGVIPSNEGRGYVLRRILRRALRFGKKIGLHKPFLYEMAAVVSKEMSCQYKDLPKNLPMIQKIIRNEEEKFLQTLNKGIGELDTVIDNALKNKSKVIEGAELFKLYDTFGLPYEVIQEVAEENELELDKDGFDLCMNEQKTKGKKSWKGTVYSLDAAENLLKDSVPTLFLGYCSEHCDGAVTALLKSDEKVDSLKAGDEGVMVTNQSVLYAESGGQVFDRGLVSWPGGKASVREVQKSRNGVFLHSILIEEGTLHTGMTVILSYDAPRRNEIRKNHTSTHLLQFALRKHLGQHIKQAGSLVSDERLRFDFSHTLKVSPEELRKVELEVNALILENLSVEVNELSLKDAKESREIIANFGEKYGAVVRMVNVGGKSMELCGGTHISNTGLINGFKIISEGSVSAGVRRIEAVTGKAFLEKTQEQSEILSELASEFKVPYDKVQDSVSLLQQKVKELEKKLAQKKGSAGLKADVDFSFTAKETEFIIQGYNNINGEELLSVLDGFKQQKNSLFAFLVSSFEDKLVFLSSRKNFTALDCSKVLKDICAECGGKGGGQPDIARGGGKDVALLETGLKKAAEAIKKIAQ